MDKVMYSIGEAAAVTGVSRSRLYLEIKSGRLKTKKVGRRTVILGSDLTDWGEQLPQGGSSVRPQAA